MYGDGVCINRATNGYTVSMRDPAIEAKNRKRSLKGNYDEPYIDPQKTYVFSDIDAVMTFLKANIDKALPKDDYGSAFDTMAAEDDD